MLTLLHCVFPPTCHTHALLLRSQFLENGTVPHSLEPTEDTLSLFRREQGRAETLGLSSVPAAWL